MRYLNGVLCLLMLLFGGVQYNDPDGLMWVAIYLVPAAWAAIAFAKPLWLRQSPASILLPVCILAAFAATIYYWPKTTGWWTKDVWWEVETAREGMGMMIVTVVLLVAWFSGRKSKADIV